MEESVKSDSRLEVSVSFGRFENDTLSWEKWSSFSPNKYLEEVGTLSTPGSVAQKKAYFEAHYKKIATRKAEQLEQENSVEHVHTSQDETTIVDHPKNSSEIDAKFETRKGDGLVVVGNCSNVFANEAMVDEAKDDEIISTVVMGHRAFPNGLVDVTTSEEENEDDATAMGSRNCMVQEAGDEFNNLVVDPVFNFSEEALTVGEHITLKDSQKIVEHEHPPKAKSRAAQLTELKKETSKINPRNIPKAIPTKMERNLTGKNKVILPAVKPWQASTPKSSKPALVSTPISSSQSGIKKITKSPLPESKNFLKAESKRAAPTSLHMSLSLGPANSSAVMSMTRKSLIMEKMGDKDIVKRAFKSFHNQIKGYPTDENSSTLRQVPPAALETKIPPSPTLREENKWPRKVSETPVSRRNKLGQQLKPFPSGSNKISVLDRKNNIAISPSIGMKGDDRSEKRKEFIRSLEAKSISREAENARLRAKSREEKEFGIRKPRQNLSFKATPLPSFCNRGLGNGHVEKGTTLWATCNPMLG
ncbi:protein WVD2-like 7 isoform X2 [Henckelia pumila]|uniref:protein WVD2-like 7 isoform X2 n=1 Tax=Henckelia pumila TaxID=405737 RepID=UPI003C6E0A9D